jgi:hypothetical protein
MAEAAQIAEGPIQSDTIHFLGTSRNFVPAVAVFVAGALAFPMGMTEVFFTAAIAWTFVLWGILLIYIGLLDVYETYEITDDVLIIDNVLRPWGRRKEWAWSQINRMDIVIRRRDHRPEHAMIQVYYTPEGEISIEREDRSFDPELAQLVIDRAGLSAIDSENPADLQQLPLEEKATFSWR